MGDLITRYDMSGHDFDYTERKDGDWILYGDHEEAIAAVQADKAAIRADALREGAIAGWNACRKSIYAVCEDIGDKAHANLEKPDLGDHEKGFHTAEKYIAKSIARGFGAMEAENDDNLTEALARFDTPAVQPAQGNVK